MKRYLLIIGLLLLSIVSINCQEESSDKNIANKTFKVCKGMSRSDLVYTIRPNGETFEVYEGISRVNQIYTIRPE